jgi:uncharacterized protein YfaS (alpha-2-macroglobulin family)
MSMETYIRGETVRVIVYVRDINGALMTPTVAPTATIYDPRGTAIVTSGVMTTTATGIYSYSYATLATSVLGTWVAHVTATDGAHTLVEIVKFGLRGVL